MDSGDPQHPIFIATKRLVTALDRLEDSLLEKMTVPSRDPEQDEQLALFEQENETLRQERENLNSAIATLESQYGDLHKAASTIYGKLDDSIKRLTQIIEN